MIDKIKNNPWRSLPLLALLVLSLAVARVVRGSVIAELQNFRPWPASDLTLHPERIALPGLQSVWFPSRDGERLSGWMIPSRNGAAVILAHGTHADRASLLPEARILASAGFGVLAFDWPGYGKSESAGPVRWDGRERAALSAAIDFLSKQHDVDPSRIGGFGLSMGAYILTQVAADDRRFRAVALESTPAEMIEQTRNEHRRWGLLSMEPALLALEWVGMPVREKVPKQVVGQIAPRPVFVIGGDQDPAVDPAMTEAFFAAARQPKSLWLVPGGGHGGYAAVAPDEYSRRLVSFFGAALAR